MTTSISPAPHGAERPARSGSDDLHDVATVLLLLLGGFLVPLLGWLAGVVMLWASPRFTTAQRWLGTLVWPAVVAVPLVPVAIGLLAGGPARGGAWFLAAAVLGGLGVLVVLPTVCVHLLRGRRAA